MTGRILRITLLLSLLLALLPWALAAETPAPTVEPTTVPMDMVDHELQYYLFEHDSQGHVLDLKSALNDFGYYPSAAQDGDKRSDFLDSITMVALERCCKLNNLPYDPYGVTTEAYFAITNRQIIDQTKPTPTPSPMGDDALYHPIAVNESSDAVTALQGQLKKLGYAIDPNTGEPVELQLGVYTREMQQIIAFYCRENNLNVPGLNDPISPQLQGTIMKDTKVYVLPTPTPEPTPTSNGKIIDYFTAPRTLFGKITMPTWGVWLVAMALVAAIVLVMIYFFMPGSSDSGKKKGGKRGGKIKFIIEYDGKKKEYSCDIDHTLKIYYSGKTLMIRDYSTNGTFVNGKACNAGEYALHSGDTIKIGAHTLTILF